MKKQLPNVPYRIFKPLVGLARVYGLLCLIPGLLAAPALFFLAVCGLMRVIAPTLTQPRWEWFVAAIGAVTLSFVLALMRNRMVHNLKASGLDPQLQQIRKIGPISSSGHVLIFYERNYEYRKASCKLMPPSLIRPLHRVLVAMGYYNVGYSTRQLYWWDTDE